jgi:hypothetical protein
MPDDTPQPSSLQSQIAAVDEAIAAPKQSLADVAQYQSEGVSNAHWLEAGAGLQIIKNLSNIFVRTAGDIADAGGKNPLAAFIKDSYFAVGDNIGRFSQWNSESAQRSSRHG